MGKLKAFRITLSPDEVVYSPGSVIAGQCEVEVADGEIGLKSLAITLRGVSKVHWTESRNVGIRLGPYTQHFMSGDQYIRERKVLAHPRMGADRVTLRDGVYRFPFSFIFPTSAMPSSFVGKYGSTRYWLRGELQRLRNKSDKTIKTIVFVNPLNVNLPEYQEVVESAADNTLCCTFCIGGMVSIHASTNKSGYMPGDSIILSAQFENFTSRRLYPTVALYQRQYYYASDCQKMRTVQLVKFSGEFLSSKNNISWRNEQLIIPNVIPSIINCNVLKVVYFVKVSLKIPGSLKVSTILPITIGSDISCTSTANSSTSQVLSPPSYEQSCDLPAYDCSTTDEDDDYLQPPNSRSQTPPPCYSDIFDSDSDEEDELQRCCSSMDDATTPEDVVTTM